MRRSGIMARYDFAPELGLVAALDWLRHELALEPCWARIERVHVLSPDGLLVIWGRRPAPSHKEVVADRWREVRPRGFVQHRVAKARVESEAEDVDASEAACET
jgi:hypothetical protein